MPEWGGERLCLGGGSSDVGAVGRGCQAAGGEASSGSGGLGGLGGLGGFVVSIRCCSTRVVVKFAPAQVVLGFDGSAFDLLHARPMEKLEQGRRFGTCRDDSCHF